MLITLFAKKRNTKEGKVFYQFLTTLEKKDGTTETMRVAFRDVDGNSIPKPDTCPRIIEVKRENANVARTSFTDNNTGEIKYRKTLWVTAWESGPEYVDHSLDEYNV